MTSIVSNRLLAEHPQITSHQLGNGAQGIGRDGYTLKFGTSPSKREISSDPADGTSCPLTSLHIPGALTKL
ncbi:hypothetical protein CTA1_2924 [Colletotrichum tanaceti]|uniref:Uncharacterized protein n=1 Tax=Colletotrichum tanaceti TaxID=1306861 RepID=A0A4V6DIS5_9PEZI|nr:hypothetical protein CTA1_2924 [Colletotrichum tanaceti]